MNNKKNINPTILSQPSNYDDFRTLAKQNNVVPEASSQEIKQLKEEQNNRRIKADNIIQRLKNCDCGKGMGSNGKSYWKEFEDICFDFLNLVLENDFIYLALEDQNYDYVIDEANNPAEIEKDFKLTLSDPKEKSTQWKEFKDRGLIETVVFECKNTNHEINAQYILQIYTYMENQGSSIGIFLCRGKRKRGYDHFGKLGKRAIKQMKREGYPIIVLDEISLEGWLNCYVRNGDSNEFIGTTIRSQLPHEMFTRK